MMILVPLAFLIAGTAVVMILLYRNLVRLDGEASEAWRLTQTERLTRITAATHLVDTLTATGLLNEQTSKQAERALAACQTADGPEQASPADAALAEVLHRYEEATTNATSSPSLATRAALDQLRVSDEHLAFQAALYNNKATLYNNAGVTFPALLVARWAHFEPRATYRPPSEARADADRESLAEKSPHIMNAYMLWAVGMSDTTMESTEESS